MQSSMTYQAGITQLKLAVCHFLARAPGSAVPFHTRTEIQEMIASLEALMCKSCNHPVLDPEIFRQTNDIVKVTFL